MYRIGDRVENTMTKGQYGTVVKCMHSLWDEDNYVPVRWDHINYGDDWRHTLPPKYLVRKLTKLEKALK